MDNNESFFIDVLKIVPNDVACYISTSNEISDSVVKDMLNRIEDIDFDNYINLNENNISIFVKRLQMSLIIEYFDNLEIRKNHKLLFRGYDGIESGTFSKTMMIPDWFKEKYKLDWDYSISNDW